MCSKCLPSACKHPQRQQYFFHTLHKWAACQSFHRYCKNKFLELSKIFCFNVKETGLRAIVDSVTIIFKIWNQDIVALCIMGCGKKKIRNTPLVNNPVLLNIKIKRYYIQDVSAKTFESNISVVCERIFMKFKMQIF
jgi:hypothetical protein